MKQTMYSYLTILLSAAVFTACGDQASTENEHKHEQEMTSTETPVKTGEAQISDATLNAVYPHYLTLAEALVTENTAQARISANAIAVGTESLGSGNSIYTQAKRIAESDQLDELRTLFSPLSNELIEKIKAAGVSSGAVYVEFCPMAFNDKGGYWLSDKKTIRNPYYGDEMLNCGTVKETLGSE